MDQEIVKTQIFSGEFRHSMDDKNRVTVPASWRQRTDGEEFFLVPDPTPNSNSLLVLPPEEFRNTSLKLEGNASVTPQMKRVFKKLFHSRAKQCFTDRQGRILLPEDLKIEAGLGTEVVLIGVRERFEIWDPDQWVARSTADDQIYKQVAGMIDL